MPQCDGDVRGGVQGLLLDERQHIPEVDVLRAGTGIREQMHVRVNQSGHDGLASDVEYAKTVWDCGTLQRAYICDRAPLDDNDAGFDRRAAHSVEHSATAQDRYML